MTQKSPSKLLKKVLPSSSKKKQKTSPSFSFSSSSSSSPYSSLYKNGNLSHSSTSLVSQEEEEAHKVEHKVEHKEGQGAHKQKEEKEKKEKRGPSFDGIRSSLEGMRSSLEGKRKERISLEEEKDEKEKERKPQQKKEGKKDKGTTKEKEAEEKEKEKEKKRDPLDFFPTLPSIPLSEKEEREQEEFERKNFEALPSSHPAKNRPLLLERNLRFHAFSELIMLAGGLDLRRYRERGFVKLRLYQYQPEGKWHCPNPFLPELPSLFEKENQSGNIHKTADLYIQWKLLQSEDLWEPHSPENTPFYLRNWM